MADAPTRVTAPSEIAQLFLRTTRDQLRAAQAEEWSIVFELADFRDLLMKRLADSTATQVDRHERDAVMRTLLEIQAIDQEITRCAHHESRRLQDELAEMRQGRAIAHGYGWASGAGPFASVDRYG